MVVRFATLQQINHDHKITRDTDFEFVYQLEYALLLALRESRTLNAMQFRQAEEKLKHQRQERARKLIEKGGTD